MKAHILFLTYLALSVFGFQNNLAQDSNFFEIVDLTDSTYFTFLNNLSDSKIVNLFYVNWCYWCKEALTELAGAAALSKAYNYDVKFTRIDIATNPKVAKLELINSFPTFSTYFGNKKDYYPGKHSRNEIFMWIDREIDSDKNITSTSQLNHLLSYVFKNNLLLLTSFDNEYTRTTFYDSKKNFGSSILSGELINPNMLINASQLIEINPSLEFNPPFIASLSPINYDRHRMHVTLFPGNMNDSTQIKNFIEVQRFPLLFPVTEYWLQTAFHSGDRPILLIIDKDFENPKVSEEKYNYLKELAQTYRNKILIGCMSNSSPFESFILNILQIDSDLPAMRIIQAPHLILSSNNFLKYRPKNDSVDFKNIEDFIELMLKGMINPYIKSEVEFYTNDESIEGFMPIKVLIGNNFEFFARNPKTDALVMFHAPWCGHCRELLPIIEEVGRLLRPYNTILIGKIDATLNEVLGVPINGYPNIFFFPASTDPTPVKYTGRWKSQAIITWLSKHVKSVKLNSNNLIKYIDPEIKNLEVLSYGQEEL